MTPHEPLEKLEQNLWACDAATPGLALRRRVVFARRADGRVVVFNAVPLDDATQREVESLGELAFLVTPNKFHRIDIAPYKARYPGIAVYCPAPARKAIEERAPVAGALADLPADADVELVTLDGGKAGEPVMIVRSGARTSLVFGDAVMNMPDHLPGFAGFVIRLLGSTGGPKVTRLFRWFGVADRAAMKAHLLRLADTPGLARLVPSHGVIEAQDAPGVLRTAAGCL